MNGRRCETMRLLTSTTVHAAAVLLICANLRASDGQRPESPDATGADQTMRAATDPLAAAAAGEPFVVTQPAGPPPTPRHTGIKALFKDLWGDVEHLPSKENAIWAAVGGGLALAVHPADESVNHAMVNSQFAHDFFEPGAVLGQFPTLITAAVTVYVVGRVKDQPKVSHVGMDLIQALVLSEGMVQTLKDTTRRERPDGSGPTSFPSGHASDTFAFATALERHLGWKGAVPAVHLRLIRRDVAAAGEPSLAERRRLRIERRHHRRTHRDQTRP